MALCTVSQYFYTDRYEIYPFIYLIVYIEISVVPWILKAKLSHEISSGMSYLHSLEIIHCDLKLQNVLVGEQINAKVCIQ